MIARRATDSTQQTSQQQSGQQTGSSGDSPTIQQLRPLVQEANATSDYNARLNGSR
jgi:hypothetical protein